GRGEEYWPTTEAKKFGDIIVFCLSETTHRRWTVRDFIVTNIKSKESHQARHFHFNSWQESGDMLNKFLLLQFLHQVHQYKKQKSSTSPTLVHCRTGTGRCGIFISLDCIMYQLEDGKSVNVYGTVHKMLFHRPLMVQTEDQYIFLHLCTLDIVRLKKNGAEYENIMEERVNDELSDTNDSGYETHGYVDHYELCL
ncbi:hypothetical protein GDO81_021067, partial [Engystomops pustulosus]